MELFKNLGNQIKAFKIAFKNIDDKKLFRLFDDHSFPNLKAFALMNCNLKR